MAGTLSEWGEHSNQIKVTKRPLNLNKRAESMHAAATDWGKAQDSGPKYLWRPRGLQRIQKGEQGYRKP